MNDNLTAQQDPSDDDDDFNVIGGEIFATFSPWASWLGDGNPFAPTAIPMLSTQAGGTDALGDPGSMVAVTSGGITINLIFDAAALAAPASFRTGIQQAVAILAAAISDKITVNIKIDYSGTGGGAAAGPDHGVFQSYSSIRADLVNNASPGDTMFNALAAGSTIQGQSNVAVWNAQLKLWGLMAANDTTTDDGSASFATDISPNLLVGVALHELTHAMGRVPYGSQPDIFDLFRFTGAGTRLFQGGATAPAAYFSLDGGNSKVADYGRTSDPSDFLNSGVQGPNDPFNEFYTGSTSQQLTATDLKQLVALGFHLASAGGNHAPVLTVPASNITASAGQSLQMSSLFSATDADNDPLTYYFQDSNTAANSGHFALNGTPVAAASFSVNAAQLAQLVFVAGAMGTTDDLSMQVSDGHAVSNVGQFHVSVPQGPSQFGQFSSPLTAFAADAGGWTDQDHFPRLLADVNGDGMADIVGFGGDSVIVSLATGGGHFGSPVLGIQNFTVNSGGWTSQDHFPRLLADVNGDGMADIVAFGGNSVIVSLATGGGHFASPVLGIQNFTPNSGGWTSQDQFPRELADVNGDGMADIVAFGGNSVIVSLATGGGHFASPVLGIQNFTPNSGGWTGQDQFPRELADVNGDGMADIVAFGGNSVIVSLATGGGHFASPILGIQNFTPNSGGWNSRISFRGNWPTSTATAWPISSRSAATGRSCRWPPAEDTSPRRSPEAQTSIQWRMGQSGPVPALPWRRDWRPRGRYIGFGHDGVWEALSNGFHLV